MLGCRLDDAESCSLRALLLSAGFYELRMYLPDPVTLWWMKNSKSIKGGAVVMPTIRPWALKHPGPSNTGAGPQTPPLRDSGFATSSLTPQEL